MSEAKNAAAQAMRALVKPENCRRDTEHYREMARVSAKARREKAKKKKAAAKFDALQAAVVVGIVRSTQI